MGATHSALPANHAATTLEARRLPYEVALADQIQQTPKRRKVEV